MKEKSTFDQWHAAHHNGFSFDTLHLQPHMDKHKAFTALTKKLREYVSHMVQDE